MEAQNYILVRMNNGNFTLEKKRDILDEELPNEICIDVSGKNYTYLWYNQDGLLHRENYPAKVIYYFDTEDELLVSEEYYRNGELHSYDNDTP